MNNILKMKSIRMNFGGICALDDVSFNVNKGSVHALIGENGAGKSTLMNILSGVIPYGRYSGQVIFKDNEQQFNNVSNSKNAGIAIVHQEFSLMPNLSIAENIFIGNEYRNKLGFINWKQTNIEATKFMNQVGLEENPNTLIKDLSTGKKQLVEIAKALSKKCDLLILDEPTASLNEKESKMLLDIVLRLKRDGVTCIIISHKLSELSYVADKVTILRDGKSVDTIDNANHKLEQDNIVPLVVGRKILDYYPKRNTNIEKHAVFEVSNYSVAEASNTKLAVDNVSLKVKEHEIVGLYGLQGAGCSEFARSLFGQTFGKYISGATIINGKKVFLKSPKKAIEAGLAYVTDDRKKDGLLLNQDVEINTTLSNLEKVIGKLKVINHNKESQAAQELASQMNTKINSTQQLVKTLSGGNQQKVLLSKWLFSDPRILILDDPTRGIDIGAKHEIYKIMNDIVSKNKSILMISSELPELIGMCDRLYVMHKGRILNEFLAEKASQETIMKCIYEEDFHEKPIH